VILVDTSIWIDLLGTRPSHQVALEDQPRLATCGPVIQEVLQGAQLELVRRLEADLLALPRLGDPIDVTLHIEAAALYRLTRGRGHTVRSSVDCLIAAIALRHGATVWHRDRDFEAIAKVSPLQTWTAARLRPG
jgi:predicted nucleic acid-binding protein